MTRATMENGMPLPAEDPEPEDEGAALARLEAAIRLHTADFHRARAAERSAFARFAWAALLAAAPALVAAGLLIQQQFGVLPDADPTGGWRDWVWERYGAEIAACQIRKAAGDGECAVTIAE